MAQTAIDWSQSYATWSAGDGSDIDEFTIDLSGTGDPDPWDWANLVNSYIAASYDFHRGAALSVKGRSANSAGVVADIAAGTLGHVLRRDATPAVTFGTLLAGAFTTGPGIVTPAMMDNGSACSVLGVAANSSGARADIAAAANDRLLGRSSNALSFLQATDAMLANMGARSVKGRAANSSGVPADIAGGGAGQVLSDDGSTLAFRSLATLQDEVSSVAYEVNFSTLANNTFADGTEVIDGLSWTVANAAEAGTFDISNGNGLRFIVATSNGGASTMNSTTQAAAYLYLPLSSIPGYNPAYTYIAEIYCSTLAPEASGEGVMFGLWDVANSPNTGSAAKFRSGDLIYNGANRVARVTVTTTNTSGTENRNGHNVIQVRINGLGTGPVSTGTWGSTWPLCSTALVWNTATAAPLDTYSHNAMRLVLAFPSANDASPTTACTVQRMRIRRVA